MSNNERFASLVHTVVRSYTWYSPVRKGKYRLIQQVRNAFPHYSNSLLTISRDGRTFELNLATGMYDTLYFLGDYESFLTSLVGRLVGEGDVCIDAGANFGWYTTFLAACVGDSGSVHAFEPVPTTFAELRRNAELNGQPNNVVLNNLALSSRESSATITVFDRQPTGHASLADKGGGVRIECRTISLDKYLVENNIPRVAFVKVDIEGAELEFLRGADRLFDQPNPPVIIMEMALEQSKPFGYLPNDLIEHIRSRAAYEFFKIDEVGERLYSIEALDVDDIGANILCVPLRASEMIREAIQDLLDP